MRTLIVNAYVLDMATDYPNIQKKDILIKDNIIELIDENIDIEVDRKINAKGMLVMPGIVNTHTHLAMSIFRGYKTDKKLVDWLENAIYPVEDKLKPEDIYWNSYLSCLEMIKSGTTTCNDMYFGMNKTLEAIDDIGLRSVVAWCIKDDSIGDKVEQTRLYSQKYNNNPTSRIKIYVSADSPATCSPETLKLCVNLAKELNTGLHIHLAENIEEETRVIEDYNVSSSIDYLNSLNVFDVPVVLAHGTYVTQNDISILKNINGGISHNPISSYKITSTICDVKKLKSNGIYVGLGTDGIGNISSMDMFEEMKTTGYLQKQKAYANEESMLSPYEILKMATIDGAKVLGLDKEIGSIEVGKKADIIFVKTNKAHLSPDTDICYNLVYSANGSDVDTVMIDGKVLMQNRKMININERNVIKEVKKIAKRLL